ncbi:MAG: RHS repeat domain-containing protein, partial [Gammaproteobacteria bacterium]
LNTCNAGSPVVTSKVTEFEYDEAPSVFHGNLTRGTVRLFEGSHLAGIATHVTTTRNQYLDNEAAWHLGRLTRTEVYRESDGTSATRTSSFEYDPVSGLISAETVEPDAGPELRLRTEYMRNPNGTIASTRVKGSADAGQDRVTSTWYDSFGQFPSRVAKPITYSVYSTTNPDTGALATSTENGRASRFAYDTFGRQTSFTGPPGTSFTTSRGWCSGGTVPACTSSAVLRVEHRKSDGGRTWTDLDVLEREIGGGRIGFDGTPIVWRAEYNARGEVARRSNPAFIGDPVYWTTYTYDGVGRVLTEAAPRNQGGGSRTTAFAYNGLSTTQTDPRGNSTTRWVNAVGNLKRVSDASSNVTAFRYDAFDNLVATVDPRGNEILNTYDLRGRKLSTRDPDLGLWSYGYNGFGDLLWQRDAKGQVQTLTYDRRGRTLTRTEPEGITTWTWNSSVDGALSSVSSAGGYVRTHTYDWYGRPVQTTETIGGVSFAFTRTYEEPHGRLLLLQYPGGTTVRYGYNAYGYLASLTDNAQATYWTGISQDAQGNWTLYRTGNNVETLRSHDQANGWIQTILSGFGNASAGGVQSLNFSWDDVGNLTQRTDQAQGGLFETFTYDALDRVRSSRVFVNGGSAVPEITYGYDLIGNIVAKSDVGTYSYGSARPHAVTATSGMANRASAYTYDANGNQLTGLGRSLEWTSYNLPARVVQGGSSIAYQYGAERQTIRAISALPATDSSADDVLYAGGGLYEQHRRGRAVTHRYHLQIGGQPIGMVILAGSPSAPSKLVQYFHHDHLDSVSTITAGNTVVERHAYEAFGKRRYSDWRPDAIDSLLSATHEVDQGFTGHEHADHVGLIHMGGRVYDPILGRFASPDPFVQFPDNAQAYNRYSYVLNNPLSNTDPSGFFLKRIKRELKRWERDFRHEIRRPNSYLGSSIRIVGAAASYYCGAAYAACVAGVEAATSRAQGVTGDALFRNTAIAAGAAYGFNYVGNEYAAGTLSNIVGHGVVGGLSSLAGGEKFGPGFLSGAVASWAGPMVPDSPFLGSLGAAVVGGTASELGGGKFANGAITGAFGHLFNRCLHGRCESDLEQGMYDWWPGYKFGTGISNVMDGGEMTGWEMVDGAGIGLGVGAKGLNLAFSGGSNTVFWAGFDKGALATARTLGVTLDKTLGGGLMSWLQYDAKIFRFPNFMWRWASATLARNATGTAKAVIRGHGETWLTVEQPILNQRRIPIKEFP